MTEFSDKETEIEMETTTICSRKRTLLEKKQKLHHERDDKRLKIQVRENELRAIEEELKKTENEITLEMEKAFHTAQAQADAARLAAIQNRHPTQQPSSQPSSLSLETYAYPYQAKRILHVWPLPGNWDHETERKQYPRRRSETEFTCLEEALKTSRPGDLIAMQPGRHVIGEDNVIRHSVQIVGMGGGGGDDDDACKVILSDMYDARDDPYDLREDEILHVSGGGHVRIANIKIECIRVHPNDGIGGCSTLWLDGCELSRGTCDSLTVEKNAAAIVTNCKFRGGESHAIKIDPEAKQVHVSQCVITGYGTGDKDVDSKDKWNVEYPVVRPGERGAIEISVQQEYQRGQEPTPGSIRPKVNVVLRDTIISSCHGHAFCYRATFSEETSEEASVYSWPGQVKVTMDGNSMISNGLALPPGTVPDREEFVLNTQTNYRERVRNEKLKEKREKETSDDYYNRDEYDY